MLLKSAAAVAALALAGPAGAENQVTPDNNPRPCPLVRSIDGFKPVDDRTVIIDAGAGRKYLVKFANKCREMKWAWFARVEARPGMCLSRGDILVFGNQGFVDRCWIDSIAQLPPQGEAAQQSPASY
jgi:hypothetical protein